MKWFIFDWETTGLILNTQRPLNKQPHGIELYGCILDTETFEILDEIDTFLDPGVPISAEITKITGITAEMVVGAPKFDAIADRLRGLIEGADAVLAHNLSYDKPLTDFEFARIGQSLEWPQLLCSLEATEWLKGFRLSLSALHEELFGEPFTGAHRAAVDVQALTRCVVEMIKRGWL